LQLVVRVLHPLVHVSEKVDTGAVRESRLFVPPSPFTYSLTVSLYRTKRPVVDHRMQRDKPRTVVADSAEEPGINSWVPRSDRVAELTIPMPALNKPVRDRAVALKLHFEATSLHVRVDPRYPAEATPEELARLRRVEAVIKYAGDEDLGLATSTAAASGGAGSATA
jgi:hypothetical protein